jgi:hypothetical protein
MFAECGRKGAPEASDDHAVVAESLPFRVGANVGR